MKHMIDTAFTVEAVRALIRDLHQIKEYFCQRPYNMTAQIYTANTYITVVQKCFAVMFTNVGDTTANINGMVVFPSPAPTTSLGDSRVIMGHKNDLYKGVLNLGFQLPIGPAPGIEVVQLFYAD